MKYGEIIQDLASRGQNWKFYDENFRFLRQSNPTLYPWGNIQRELWLQAQAQVSVNKQSLPANNVLPAKTNKQGQIPKGFCYCFHKGKVVVINIHVLSVRGIIPFFNAIFVPPRSIPEPLPTPNSPNHSLPTPVKVDRLCKLLSGYKPSIVDSLLY